MNNEKKLKKTAHAVGTVFGLFLGDDYTSPTERTLKEHPLDVTNNVRLV